MFMKHYIKKKYEIKQRKRHQCCVGKVSLKRIFNLKNARLPSELAITIHFYYRISVIITGLV